jgi:hypothetical protein
VLLLRELACRSWRGCPSYGRASPRRRCYQPEPQKLSVRSATGGGVLVASGLRRAATGVPGGRRRRPPRSLAQSWAFPLVCFCLP